jgi:hypothetical protein
LAKFDITSRAVDEYKLLHLKDADENLLWTEETDPADPTKTIQVPVTIPVFGPGSREHAVAAAKRQTRNIAQLNKRGKVVVVADDENTSSAEWLADITGDFSANFDYPPAAGKVGRDFKIAVFTDRRVGFLGDQIAAEVKDWANFSKGSATS